LDRRSVLINNSAEGSDKMSVWEKTKAVAGVATGGTLPAAQALTKGDVEGAGVSLATGGLNKVDEAFTGGKIGSTIAGLNPFKAPDLKDIPDPTAPKNLERPTMDPNAKAATAAPVGALEKTTIGSVADPKSALINMSQQGQFRDYQSGLAAQLAAQAAGQGPSLAVNALKQGQEANLAATMAQQASLRGAAAPGMARATMQTAAEIQGKAAQEAAQARLAEQMQAQQLLGQVSGAAREQDIGLATQQAQLEQQTALAKYQGDLQLAVEQGRITSQEAQAMFNQANETARYNAGLQQQFMALQAQYAAMGLDADKANQLAALEIERMKQGAVQAQNAQSQAANAANKQMFGQILQAGATVGGAALGGPAGAAAGSAAGGAVAGGGGGQMLQPTTGVAPTGGQAYDNGVYQ
jgi:hypothetical protein